MMILTQVCLINLKVKFLSKGKQIILNIWKMALKTCKIWLKRSADKVLLELEGAAHFKQMIVS